MDILFKYSGDLTRHQRNCSTQHPDHVNPPFIAPVEGVFIGGEILPGIHISARQCNPDHLVILSRGLPKDIVIICGWAAKG